MRNLIILSALLIGFNLLTSCSKSEEDTEAPQIRITSPAQGSTYIPENDVPIRIEITENDDLHTYDISITSDADQSVLWDQGEHEHGTSLTIAEDWFAPGGFDGTVTLSVEAEDHNGNIATTSVGFSIMP